VTACMDSRPSSASHDRLYIGDLPIDRITFEQAIASIESLVALRCGGAVFTPNVDHIVQFHENPRLREAYEAASLCLVDGTPVVWASRLLGRPLPEKISGSDLVMPLVQRAAVLGWRLFLLGAADGVAELAKARMEAVAPGLKVVGTLSPRVDFTEPRERRRDVVEAVRSAAPDLVFVAFGAPKQELWIHESRDALRPAVFLGVGTSLDFVAGLVPRAPAWVSRAGLEWLYRLSREPRRLWRRYLVRDPKFALILLRSLRAQRLPRGKGSRS
jgi:N-acetylglucosaminyldiphosphoundecaprenol N-acetyl-beta-D-mannosaminyltransferase